MNENLNVIALNDICSYGKVSLTINIPVLSAFSIKVSPLPTVLLSNHTQFESFCAFDLTKEIFAIYEELKKRNPKFDAFYVGWLGDEKQVALAVDIIDFFKIPITVIDPILGDNGKLYTPITQHHVDNMRRLIKYANVITPNITEAAALLNESLDKKPDIATLKEWSKRLTELGPKSIVITSVEAENNTVGSLCYSEGVFSEYYCPKVDIHIPGTGDAFGSALLGYMLTGKSLLEAAKKSTEFVYKSVEAAAKEGDDRIYGIAIEKRLHLL